MSNAYAFALPWFRWCEATIENVAKRCRRHSFQRNVLQKILTKSVKENPVYKSYSPNLGPTEKNGWGETKENAMLRDEKQALLDSISEAQVRLDAMRLVRVE